MLKLNLQQNALHTLYHGIEHLKCSGDEMTSCHEFIFDHNSHEVEWINEHGNKYFYLAAYTKPPSEYGLKFAILHFIQACELILKAYIERVEPSSLFKAGNIRKTINIWEARKIVAKYAPEIIVEDYDCLLLQAKDLRNQLEHYELCTGAVVLRGIATDFLALCIFYAQSLLDINIVEIFAWDAWREEPDKVGEYLSEISVNLTPIGKKIANDTANIWSIKNPGQVRLLCLNCGSNGLSQEGTPCIACGADGDPEISRLLEELNDITRALLEQRSRFEKNSHRLQSHRYFCTDQQQFDLPQQQ